VVDVVEPMGRECDQMQIIAISSYLGVQVNIEYLDGQKFEEAQGLSLVTCGEAMAEAERKARSISLLYRPGHYDILYK
jgi:ubiquitin thioesterase protein OTUB1